MNMVYCVSDNKYLLVLNMDSLFNSTACESTWTVINNIYTNGMYAIGAKTLAQCKDRCVANPNCVAIDHNYKDGNCWMGEKTSDLVNQYRWTDGNQYILKSRCDTPVTNREITFNFKKQLKTHMFTLAFT